MSADDVVIYDEFPEQPQPYPGDLIGADTPAAPRFADVAGRPLTGFLNARNERDEGAMVEVVGGALGYLPPGTYRLTGILRGPAGAHMIAETVTL